MSNEILIEVNDELVATIDKCREIVNCPKGIDLQDHLRQLAAENMALSKDAQRYRFIRERDMFGSDNESGLLSWEELTELECKEFDDALDARINHPNTGFIEFDAKLQARETPATDRIIAGIKADGVEEFAKYISLYNSGAKHHAINFAKHLREGLTNEF
ncbi:TPA: hypothetical protein MA058_003431 [Klebsiella pneumoniae]|nr:hypothetical protein [Klebsiella pneumoniae]